MCQCVSYVILYLCLCLGPETENCDMIVNLEICDHVICEV